MAAIELLRNGETIKFDTDDIKVYKNGGKKGKTDTTDMSLMLDGLPSVESDDSVDQWDIEYIIEALQLEAGLDEEEAEDIANAVEDKIMFSGLDRISTSLIRELVDNELFERGMNVKLNHQTAYTIPAFDLRQMLTSKTQENSNLNNNNPEAVHLEVNNHIMKQYALKEVFSHDVSEAHRLGEIHLHDLADILKFYCSVHSPEYIKKYGLALNNLDTVSKPAKHARTLTGHINTFLGSMQAYYAGAMGLSYINIFYAPLLEGMSDEEIKQEAQHLVFSLSQNAFNRGGSSLFIDLNLHLDVPEVLALVPAIGSGGKYTGKLYKDYEEESQKFLKAILDVIREGDGGGGLFAMPKIDLHINNTSFTDPKQKELLEYACQVTSENGSVYFIFDRSATVLSACCRLRTTIEDENMLSHPERLRFCGFMNCTLNLPQAAYRSNGDWDFFYKELDRVIELAIKAHLQKKDFTTSLMVEEGLPLYEMGKPSKDGEPYIDMGAVTHIIGLIGLNDVLQFMTGKELHDGDEMIMLGLKIIRYIEREVKKWGKKFDLKVALEETPAESTSRRLAKIDLARYPREASKIVKGDIEKDMPYYTNSIHLRPDAPVSTVERIQIQAKFNSAIEAGCITHLWVGEALPPAKSIYNLVEKTYHNTNSAQITISPEFTVCRSCCSNVLGLHDRCLKCGEKENIYGITRIVGYFSKVSSWNKSKIGELEDRHKGNYSI